MGNPWFSVYKENCEGAMNGDCWGAIIQLLSSGMGAWCDVECYKGLVYFHRTLIGF